MLKLTSRCGNKRIFRKLSDSIIEFVSYDTLYYTANSTNGNFKDIDSIDPQGGPLLYKGYKINFETTEYEIKKFTNINYDEQKKQLKVLLCIHQNKK